jgi:uncharacterized OB-fold protein
MSDLEVFERYPGRPIDRDTIAFFRGLLERRLLVNRCGDCGRLHQPPGPVCPACWSDDVSPTEVSGRGTVHSFSRPVVVVDLDEGVRATATIVNCDEPRIGMPVRLTWIERDGAPVPAFEPAR